MCGSEELCEPCFPHHQTRSRSRDLVARALGWLVHPLQVGQHPAAAGNWSQPGCIPAAQRSNPSRPRTVTTGLQAGCWHCTIRGSSSKLIRPSALRLPLPAVVTGSDSSLAAAQNQRLCPELAGEACRAWQLHRHREWPQPKLITAPQRRVVAQPVQGAEVGIEGFNRAEVQFGTTIRPCWIRTRLKRHHRADRNRPWRRQQQPEGPGTRGTIALIKH